MLLLDQEFHSEVQHQEQQTLVEVVVEYVIVEEQGTVVPESL